MDEKGAEIERVLRECRTIAVVGASPDPARPSYGVADFLKRQGYRIIPVNPGAGEVLGETAYPDLTSIPEAVEVVDIFRRSEAVLPVVEEAIAIGARIIWMQKGVVNEEAAARARESGLVVIMDRCMMEEHYRLLGGEQARHCGFKDRGGGAMSKTDDNLREAFAGESQANTRYLAFARKAEQEKHPQVARLFRAAAASEVVHARNHLEAMEGVGNTVDNLREAIAGENAEHVRMYPGFIGQAEEEERTKASRTFEWARRAEIVHESLYKAALGALEGGGEPPAKDYFVCQVCGFAAEGEAPERCPVCGAPRAQFRQVD